jgi:uncharacterized protein (TIGR00369 family)
MTTPSLTPRDPRFEQKVREDFERQRVMTVLGARLVRVAPGAVDIEMPYRESLTQQHGYLHAGIVTTIADSACGYAAFSLMPPDAGIVSVEFKVNLLAPAVGQRFLAQGRVKRAGRTLTVCTADVVAESDGHRRTVATMLGTMMQLAERP